MKPLLLKCLLVTFIFGSSRSDWDDNFDYTPCYEIAPETRMPMSIDNLVALVEIYEQQNYNTESDDIANAILNRYRKNGIVFNPTTAYEDAQWGAYQTFEVNKQLLDDALLNPNIEVPEYTYYHREECSLHLMVSHSIDLYPHSGVDYMWDNYQTRSKRSIGFQGYFGDEENRADHPIENGIVQTTSGPIALGILLSGIMDMEHSTSQSVGELSFGGKDESKNHMPDEMYNTQIDSLYGVTLSGEIAQEGLLAKDSDDIETGPLGIFGNSTSCPRMFSLEEDEPSYMSRAEIFAALDALIIAKAFKNKGSSSRRVRLSELLRMYYGEHGLFSREIRGCNRIKNYDYLDKDEIKAEALNYIYAYATYSPVDRDFIDRNQDDYDEIEEHYSELVDDAFDAFESFIKSYSYDDQWANDCYDQGSDQILAETVADLIAVFTPTGDKTEIQKQADYIGLTARHISVGYLRSRVAILDGRNGNWKSPMSNHSNIADWVCNFTTTENNGGGSTQNPETILSELSSYYAHYYRELMSDPESTGNNSQVVMWNLPKSFSGNSEDIERAWRIFNLSYPDVNVIFVGSDTKILNDLTGTEDDLGTKATFVSNQKETADEIAFEISHIISKSPRMFIYPGCIFGNDTEPEDTSYNEESHVYTNYVTPNFTTFIRIMPQNYHYSEYLKITFEDDDVGICVSRRNPTPQPKDTDSFCEDAGYDFKFYELCGRYVNECAPIYIGVSGNPDSREYCSDDECVYPNQVEFKMTHTGMICGCWGITASPLLILAVFFLPIVLRNNFL